MKTRSGIISSYGCHQGFAGEDYASAQLAYPFSEQTHRRAVDRSANGIDLTFPRETILLTPKLFASGIDSFARRASLDVIINLCGFIPLGFFLVALFAEVSPMARLQAVGAAIAIGFALSFGIELVQAWIPSRSSSLLDLLLNVAGSGLGGSAFVLLVRAKRIRPTH
jgi:glycopeptide antibiotics resistance protein